MKSQLEELYIENVGLIEKIRESEKFDKIQYKYNNIYEKLLAGLFEEQKKMLEELNDLACGLEAEMAKNHFIEGFKFCMRLVVEGLGK